MSSRDYMRVQVIPCRAPDELFGWYEGQNDRQPVHVYLDPEANGGSGRLWAMSQGELGAARPERVYSERLFRFSIPLLTGDAANELMASEEVQALAARIVLGYSREWDGGRYVGRLDEDAKAAECDLSVLLWSSGGQPLEVFDAEEFFEHDRALVLAKAREHGWDSSELAEYLRGQVSKLPSPSVLRGAERFARGLLEKGEGRS